MKILIWKVYNVRPSLHKKWGFPWRISSINVTKSAVCGGFGNIYCGNPSWKTSFFSAVIWFDSYLFHWNFCLQTGKTINIDIKGTCKLKNYLFFSFLVLLKETENAGSVQDFIFFFLCLVLIKKISRLGESKIPLFNPTGGMLLLRPSTSYN